MGETARQRQTGTQRSIEKTSIRSNLSEPPYIADREYSLVSSVFNAPRLYTKSRRAKVRQGKNRRG
ncbi:hypothetical protein CU661_25620, partial [Pseudomonas syringae pv. actinidifoliorum]|nr:hypothetical protein [Pseudomonas syringae pv. actinidifoliorum]